jgi:hypothetical protein
MIKGRLSLASDGVDDDETVVLVGLYAPVPQAAAIGEPLTVNVVVEDLAAKVAAVFVVAPIVLDRALGVEERAEEEGGENEPYIKQK